MTESKMSKTKLGVIAGLVVAALALAGGIFKAAGCEQGATVTDQIGSAVDAVLPGEPAAVEVEIEELDAPSAKVEETIRLESDRDCGQVSFLSTLAIGDRGPNVQALQAWLNCEGKGLEGYKVIDVDGVYGDGTAEAVAQRLGQ